MYWNRSRYVLTIMVMYLLSPRLALAHFTDQDWARIYISYGKACEFLYPEKKHIYSETIAKIKDTNPRLGPHIKTIEESQDQLKLIDAYALKLSKKASEIQHECQEIEDLYNKIQSNVRVR